MAHLLFGRRKTVMWLESKSLVGIEKKDTSRHNIGNFF